ncbi:Tat (twin-arginine translocation) pathway signal sequence [Halogranum amylolyticum]|uniref:Tat (Twin-arginine translocation) pathway signal sequence n=1 Tax=Halogranum amylolyticum TaxID=660520 RepID=A0A1H8S0H9_9EURY|nr:ABC transporter substrate-binding protein [Halogranum amylolyticum]SEO72047.1 Tat (twin-arginine translocation) pathway signal sequence [Halogranum amylolyticum]
MLRDIERRDFLKGVGTAGVVGLAGCTSGGDGGDGGSDGNGTGGGGGGGGDRTIQYGVLLPLTGDLGSVGQPMRDAAILPSKQLSDADLGGLSVKETVEDTQTNPSSGISAANSLINSGIPGICGPASSGVNIQVSRQVFIPNQVVGVSPSSTAPSVTDLEDDDFVYRTAPSDALQGQVVSRVANDSVGASTAATMYVNNDYGQLLSQAFVSAFEENGGTVQKEVSFEKQQSSYTSKLQSALGGGPDALVVIGYPASGVQLFTDYYADFDDGTDILVTDGMQDAQMQKQVGNPMENVTGTAPQPSGPAADAFASAYNDEYGRDPSVFNAHSYDAAATLILANAWAGENSGTAVRDAMREIANPEGTEVTIENLAEGVKMAANGEAINYAGASSAVDFDDNGDMKAVSYSVWQFAPDSESGIEVVDTIQFEA